MISLVQPSRGHITQFYGARQVDGNPHAGQDYAYSNGREVFPEVYAAADGVVLFAGDSRGLTWPNIMYVNIDFDRSDARDSSAGNYTIIAHTDARGNRVALTGYGHQENVWVKAGDIVRAGQRIGTVGETGFSYGKHLHFDLVLTPFDVDDAPYYGRVDPNPYFVAGTTYKLNSTQHGSTITQEEDDMFDDEAKARQETIDGNVKTLIGMLNNVASGVNEVPGQILAKEVPVANSVAVTSLQGFLSYAAADRDATVTRISEAIANTPAPELAAQIDAAGIAASVRDELVKLLGGK